MKSSALLLVLLIGAPAFADLASLDPHPRELNSRNVETTAGDEYGLAQHEEAPSLLLGKAGEKLRLGGYIKVDTMYDFRPAGDPDRFIVNTIPTSGDTTGGSAEVSAHSSRINLDLLVPSSEGQVRFHFDNDFFGQNGATDIRVRQIYGAIGTLVMGYGWSALYDAKTEADVLDAGKASGTVDTRQASIRFGNRWKGPASTDGVHFAIEHPETQAQVGTETPISPAPDLILAWRHEAAWGHFRPAVVLRRLGIISSTAVRDVTQGWGTRLTGSFHWQLDSLAYEVFYGHGIGRYIRDMDGTNSDAALGADGTLEALPALGTVLTLQHHWTDVFRSNLTGSLSHLSNSAGQAGNAYHEGRYISGNAIHKIGKFSEIGLELIYGRLQLKDGSEGHSERLQLSVRLDFAPL